MVLPPRGQKPQPSLSGRQVLLFHASACDELTPPTHRAPPGPHTESSPTEDPPRRAFVPGPPTDPSFDAIVVSFRCVSSGPHMFVLSSHTRPAHSETSTATLTTPALDRRRPRWFGIPACTATPQDPPPSLAQHRSCRRSSTSSSLPFRTHMGARNCVVAGQAALRYSLMSPPRHQPHTECEGLSCAVVASAACSGPVRALERVHVSGSQVADRQHGCARGGCRRLRARPPRCDH